jgi:hypothetical protein
MRDITTYSGNGSVYKYTTETNTDKYFDDMLKRYKNDSQILLFHCL